MTTAVFPGSFNPPTLAHRAIVETVLAQSDILRVDLTLSFDALGKPRNTQASLGTRCDLLAQVFEDEPRCRIVLTPQRLLTDIALGYDFLILGGDKALQLRDPIYYSSPQSMIDKLSRLPKLIIFPRPGAEADDPEGRWILPEHLRFASSSKVRSGSWELVHPTIRAQCQAIYDTEAQATQSTSSNS